MRPLVRPLTRTPSSIGFLLFAACLICLVALGAPARADTTASAFIKDLGDQALAAAADKTLDTVAKEKKFRAILKEKFAISSIARFVLGRYWRQADDAQKERYLNLFEDYVVFTYLRNFNNYSGQTFQITGERDDGEKGVVVFMDIQQNSAPPYKLEWLVKKSSKSGRWLIVDLKAEGISMAVTQRTDFTATISHYGGKLDPFLDDLQKKVASARVALGKSGEQSKPQG